VTKGDAHPLWKPHLVVLASRGGVNIERIRLATGPARERAAPVARPKRQAKLRLKNGLNFELIGTHKTRVLFHPRR
jgi:hypothetical protein